MRKSDQSLKNLSIATIKRNTILPFNFQYTKLYDHNNGTDQHPMEKVITFDEGELPICSTVLDSERWTMLTTRRILTCEGSGVIQHSLAEIRQSEWGDFKGGSKQSYTKGSIIFTDDTIIPVFIETGRASMVMIYGVETVSQRIG